MTDNAIESSSVPDLTSEEDGSDEYAGQLPIEPEEWDTALATFLGFPEGWADDFKNEYEDPVVTLLYAALPDAYIGATPADINIDEDELANAVRNLDEEQQEGLRKLAVIVFANVFHSSDTLRYLRQQINRVRSAGAVVRGQLIDRIRSNSESSINASDVQNTLASLNDPDGPFAEGVHIDEIFDEQLLEDAPSHINNQPPRPDDYWVFGKGAESQHTVRITHYEKVRSEGVLRRECIGVVVDTQGENAPEKGTIVNRSMQQFADADYCDEPETDAGRR